MPGPRTPPIPPPDALRRILATGRVQDETQWQDAVTDAAASGHLPLLAAWRDEPCVSASDHLAIDQALIANTARNQLFLAVLGQVLAWFEAAGIPSRLLKGAATLQDCYDENGQRCLGDLDLLVPTAQLIDAAAILKTHGYRSLLPTLLREALADPHLLHQDADTPMPVHHHWPPLVGPEGVVIELHWRLGDGFGAPEAVLWGPPTPLPLGEALGWPLRVGQALLAAGNDPAGLSPRALADLTGLMRLAPPAELAVLKTWLPDAAVRYRVAVVLLRIAALGGPWAPEVAVVLDLPITAVPAPDSPSSWRRRWHHLRSPGRLTLWACLGWQAWRYPRRLARLPLPALLATMTLPACWMARVTVADVVAYAGFWQRQRWIPRPSFCLQRSVLLYAGLTAIGEPVSIVFGLDPEHPTPLGHAWVERGGIPFLEDAALIGRMVPTYRYGP